jgi:hypothetical protein
MRGYNWCVRYRGIIIEESLEDKSVLEMVKILEKEIEEVTLEHKTPWLKVWTMDTVEIPEHKADLVADKISESFDKEHQWFADYRNKDYQYIIFRGKKFKVDLKNPILFKAAKEYGISVGIPAYQLDFAPDDKIWER